MHDETEREQHTGEHHRRASNNYGLFGMLRRLVGGRGATRLIMDRDGQVRAAHKGCADDDWSAPEHGG